MKRRFLGALLGLALADAAVAAPAPRPWEVLTDLAQLPRLSASGQTLLRSSFCPGGCRYDRSSEGDTRFLRRERGEAVIFDEPGAGAVTRLWMTGPGYGEPLDPGVRLRIRLDGESQPRVDLPLPDLFRGDVAPFLSPWVANRARASGGNVSYLPIPYRRGCKISLVGADRSRLWYQIDFHRLPANAAVATFTGRENVAAAGAILEHAGQNPWPAAGAVTSRTVALHPGQEILAAAEAGPDLLQVLRLRLAPALWPDVRLRLAFDGETRVDLALADFFAVGRGGTLPTRTLLLGLDADGFLYSYFPLPFTRTAAVFLSYRPPAGAAAGDIPIELEIERQGRPPEPGSGLFGAVLRVSDRTPGGQDFAVLDLAGQGKWVGLFAELGSRDTSSREYLEGDERVYLDGSPAPALYGTGVEDFFNGGFYFDQGPFRHPFGGSPYHEIAAQGEDTTAMVRLLVTDAVPFQSALRAGLEVGPTGNLTMRARTVAYFYSRPSPALIRVDRLDLGNGRSRSQHAYRAPTGARCQGVAGQFEGEPPAAGRFTVCSFAEGSARFLLRRPTPDGALRLRRRLDAGTAGQEADVYVNGRFAGTFPFVAADLKRRFLDVDLDLPPGNAGMTLAFEIVPRPNRAAAAESFTEVAYELWGMEE